MFEKILLTLDGSELAEAAVPYVRDLAGQLGAEIYLLHVCPPEHQCYLHMHQIYMNSIADGLRKQIRETWNPGSEPVVHPEVITGEAIKIITDYTAEKGIGLIVMTAHGTSGFGPLGLGSVANKIVRSVGIPSLLIRVKKDVPTLPHKALIQKILLPLDNSEASKTSIPYAIELARKLKASITLFSMAVTVYVQTYDATGTAGGSLGINWDAIDASTEKYVDEYLRGIENEIRNSGLEVDHISYLGIDAALEILEIEKKIQADLVVMATRGRSPVARWAFGSVAEKVLREGDRPIMMIKEKA
jgi:nucleotide-binding universal stress UspA family protein